MLPMNENRPFTASAPICMLKRVLQSEMKMPFISNSANLYFSLYTTLNKQKSWMTALLIAMGMENVSRGTATVSQDSLAPIVQKVISY